ncbi:MAG: bifunctional phosphopantothenoylcysteine decarboxylase/phosphopantothenate--cysteine ligase CoaBC [Christensenellales bacterium]|jgi:phosphopantothenoylcysteine decarboxylase/phosphopantothenate--cysteine ligase
MSGQRCVALGVSGSIAAYKAAELASALVKQEIAVDIVMTDNAARFITPLTFESITNRPVTYSMWQDKAQFEVEHISIAKRADLFLIVPATANVIGKYAHGVADDMLTTTLLATRAPVLIAPAMNTNMYLHEAVQLNMQTLRERGVLFVEPKVGRLACGDEGIGKLADVETILEAALGILYPKKDLAGRRVLITAGPTREAIDPVRYISNRSSGKMGFALARAAQMRGAQVVLVSGPVNLKPPYGVELVRIESVQQMYDAVLSRFDDCDMVIKAAAPADFTPLSVQTEKIKKKDGCRTLQLQDTPDILKSLGAKKQAQVLIGFAAETQNVEGYAQQKLTDKRLDMIVANDVTKEGAGFDTDTNIASVITKQGIRHFERMPKEELAHRILDIVTELF